MIKNKLKRKMLVMEFLFNNFPVQNEKHSLPVHVIYLSVTSTPAHGLMLTWKDMCQVLRIATCLVLKTYFAAKLEITVNKSKLNHSGLGAKAVSKSPSSNMKREFAVNE